LASWLALIGWATYLTLFFHFLIMASNEEMVLRLISADYADDKVANAMRVMDRKLFVPENELSHSYEDHPLPIGFGQTISAPGVVAFMTKSLDVEQGMSILEIGTGSGWQAAILSALVGKHGRIVSVERIPGLAKIGKNNLEAAGVKNVEVVCADGTLGYPQGAPYDRIIVTAAGPKVPLPLLEQLKDGGKLIMPVGESLFQELLLVEKSGKEFKQESIMPVVFVPLIGEHGHKVNR
jgi:protein-L-isoaspartate(D-aspartate) O-methyltransferase